MEYLVRLVQVHETFRRPELEALADLAGVDVEFVEYSKYSPFCIVRLRNEAAARALISRSILAKGIYELWGTGVTYAELHMDINKRTSHLWHRYRDISFKFEIDIYQGKCAITSLPTILQQLSYLGFEGPILLNHPSETFCIFEDCDWGIKTPKRVFLGRWISAGSRDILSTYSLKKRKYISTTSMDSELALLTANLTHAGPGKLFYDPFVGTGSFPIACAHFGAVAMGSDIDGRSVRGKNGMDIVANFRQYGLLNRYLDGFLSDLTHHPFRAGRFLDGILCDPPYGVREGLKVLGSRREDGDGGGKEVVWLPNGEAAHLQETYIPPKKPYSFDAMLHDILDFAARTLVDGGRLSLWMPTANDAAEGELAIPQHPCLEMVSACLQAFNKWSRRLLTYRRLPGLEADTLEKPERGGGRGGTANELNAFRRRYFEGFREFTEG
ncbi:MAG: hypothetical protein LQ342_002339 [Letrouitia transgressa]|nr:MAG: hypothetical protein LQ342_002339 [Letrouitia transgressa]